MSTREDVWQAFGRMAQRQHIARVNALLDQVQKLSVIDGFELLEKFSLQFLPGDREWDRVLYFVLLTLGDVYSKKISRVGLSYKKENGTFSLFVEFEDGRTFIHPYAAEVVLKAWRKAVETVATQPPSAF